MSSTPTVRHPVTATRTRFWQAAGGRVRGRVVFLLACVLALDTADVSMIGAIAGKLERALSISNTELGLLAAVPSLVAALATVPVGMLTDRVNRVHMVAASILVWSLAMAASGLAPSYGGLLLTRMALGAATATAGPTIASLVGDFFPASERGHMYGLILSGELLGAGFGFVVSGELASGLGWRAAFFVLALPSLVLAVVLWRGLPEPLRGGRGRLAPGATRFRTAGDPKLETASGAPLDEVDRSIVQEKVDEERISARDDLILRQDPDRMSLGAATRWVLRVPTNRVLILASALGYFYLNGVETFGLVYFRGHYGLGQSVATLLLSLLGAGALLGVVAGGRLADRLIAAGHLDGRILVGAVSSIAAALLFVPALVTRSLALSMPLFVLAAVAFSARNPALDAARLDVMHHLLWGRAEAVRTVLRRLMVATAPLLFGFLADELASGRVSGNSQQGFGATASAAGLRDAFLILVVTLIVSGLLTFRARRTYPVDVASAVASEDALGARA